MRRYNNKTNGACSRVYLAIPSECDWNQHAAATSHEGLVWRRRARRQHVMQAGLEMPPNAACSCPPLSHQLLSDAARNTAPHQHTTVHHCLIYSPWLWREFPSLPSAPLEVGPPLRLGDPGQRISSLQRVGQSPAAKRILVHFTHKFVPFWLLNVYCPLKCFRDYLYCPGRKKRFSATEHSDLEIWLAFQSCTKSENCDIYSRTHELQ